jgi:hypothetical protein
VTPPCSCICTFVVVMDLLLALLGKNCTKKRSARVAFQYAQPGVGSPHGAAPVAGGGGTCLRCCSGNEAGAARPTLGGGCASVAGGCRSGTLACRGPPGAGARRTGGEGGAGGYKPIKACKADLCTHVPGCAGRRAQVGAPIKGSQCRRQLSRPHRESWSGARVRLAARKAANC